MPHKVLIVDDDNDFRNEFKEILEEYYEVVEAANGKQAIDIIKKPDVIDLAVLDIKMPGMQGTQGLRKIKSIDPNIYVIMLTAYGEKEFILESLRGNADDFLEKPIKVKKTLNVIKKLLEGKQQRVDGLVEKIKYFIEKNYHKNVTLEEASNIVFLSPKYISKLFNESTGVGFNEYNVADCILIYNQSGILIHINKAGLDILGFNPAGLSNRQLVEQASLQFVWSKSNRGKDFIEDIVLRGRKKGMPS
ncbi:MAG: response regulator transcription factor [Spirochaetales bacterium]|nr:response regulator transcription factor [Spirochaetales bacterium]